MKYFDRNTWFWLFIAGLLFLPFLGGVPLFDWEETNFAELAREMCLTGNGLRLQLYFQPFTEVPPLYIWLQALSFNLLGVNEYAARLPNAILGMLVLPYLYISGKFLISRRFGFLWAMSWLGSILPFIYFKSGIIDPFFNFLIFNGLFFAIHYIWQKRKFPPLYFSRQAFTYLLLAGVSLGLGVLTKGLEALLIFVLTLAVYTAFSKFKNYLPWLSFLKILALIAGVFMLWVLIDGAVHGFDYFAQFAARQWERIMGTDGAPGSFWAFHWAVLLLGCFPASILALRGMGSIQMKKEHLIDFQKWMIVLLVVELIMAGYQNHSLWYSNSLAYYPISFLAALAMWNFVVKKAVLQTWIPWAINSFGLLFVLLSAAIPYLGLHPKLLQNIGAQADEFTQAALQAKVNWSFMDYAPALWLLLVLMGFTLLYRRRTRRSFKVLLFGTAVYTMLALVVFAGKAHTYSQGAQVAFFKNQQGRDVYLTTYGYKSYAPLYYGQVQPPTHAMAKSKHWLLSGKADKPVLISTKVSLTPGFEEQYPEAEFLYEKNGYRFYRLSANAE